MMRFFRRLTSTLVVASVPLAAAALATSAVSAAACDPNWSRNAWTGECHPQPPPPSWYAVRPAYAPPYAPADVPPPPPPPPWAQKMQPRWDEGAQRWYWAGI